jgi:glutathione S-transferase
MLKVRGRRRSFNVRKVMWLVGELDLAHEHIDAGGKSAGSTCRISSR